MNKNKINSNDQCESSKGVTKKARSSLMISDNDDYNTYYKSNEGKI